MSIIRLLEVPLSLALLVVAAVTSPIWLAWLSFQWWKQKREAAR